MSSLFYPFPLKKHLILILHTTRFPNVSPELKATSRSSQQQGKTITLFKIIVIICIACLHADAGSSEKVTACPLFCIILE